MTQAAILIAPDVLDRIIADARRFAGRRERGGILLGLRRGPHLHVNDATLPMPRDWGTMFSFHRSAAAHQKVALRRWKASAHTMDWMGEWHSHPQRLPAPSSIDLRSWRRMVEDRGAPMVFVIVGYEALWVGLCVPDQPEPLEYGEVETSAEGIAFERRNGPDPAVRAMA